MTTDTVPQTVLFPDLRPRVSRIRVFRPPGKPQPPGQVLVAPLELRRGELVKVAGFALQAAAAETERVAAKVQEGQTTH